MNSQQRGQALVEFSIAIILFLGLAMGIVDFGSAIYRYNGVSQAAREIGRVTSVYPPSDFTDSTTWSAQTKEAIAVQSGLIPGLTVVGITCVDASGTVATPCNRAVDSVRVVVRAPYAPVTPLLNLHTFVLEGASSVQIQ